MHASRSASGIGECLRVSAHLRKGVRVWPNHLASRRKDYRIVSSHPQAGKELEHDDNQTHALYTAGSRPASCHRLDGLCCSTRSPGAGGAARTGGSSRTGRTSGAGGASGTCRKGGSSRASRNTGPGRRSCCRRISRGRVRRQCNLRHLSLRHL